MKNAKLSRIYAPFGLAITALAALVLAAMLPTEIGGRASYVITSGNSMEPGIHQGDLVILREENEYQAGDAVVYRHPTIGQVFHRIIGRDGDTFVFQGDNNDWIDDYQPTEGEIVGKQWIHLPGAGKQLDRARQPFPMMLLAALGGLLLFAPKQAVKRMRRARRSPSRHSPERPRSGESGGPAGILGPDGQTIMLIVGGLALGSLLLAFVAFSRDTERATTTPVAFEQSGTFDYTAQAKGDVYANGAVEAGQPVYLSLVDTLDLSFDYQLTSDLPLTATGAYKLDAVVSYDEGLTRTIPLVPETPFEGAAFSADTQLALADVQGYIEQVANQIGAGNGGNRQHSLSIVPTVTLNGAVGGQAIEETFAPALAFELDGVALRLLDAAEATTATAGAEQPSGPLNPAQPGTVEQPSSAATTLSLLAFEMNVSTARQAAIFGLVLSALAGAVLASLYLSARRSSEPNQIQARYRPLLVAVNGSDLGVIGRIVEVASIEDLARVAVREGRMILHQQSGGVHDYFVQDVDVTYTYSCAERPRFTGARSMKRPA